MIIAVGEQEPKRRESLGIMSTFWRENPLAAALLYPPSRTGDTWYRLQDLAVDPLEDVVPANLNPPGDLWDKALARRTAVEILYACGHAKRPPRLWLLGRRVHEAFGLTGEVFGWCGMKRTNLELLNGRPAPSGSFYVQCLVLPHPSGRNRWFNRHENREKCREWLTK